MIPIGVQIVLGKKTSGLDQPFARKSKNTNDASDKITTHPWPKIIYKKDKEQYVNNFYNQML